MLSNMLTLSLGRGDLISYLIAQIGDLKLKKIPICMQSEQVEFDLGK